MLPRALSAVAPFCIPLGPRAGAGRWLITVTISYRIDSRRQCADRCHLRSHPRPEGLSVNDVRHRSKARGPIGRERGPICARGGSAFRPTYSTSPSERDLPDADDCLLVDDHDRSADRTSPPRVRPDNRRLGLVVILDLDASPGIGRVERQLLSHYLDVGPFRSKDLAAHLTEDGTTASSAGRRLCRDRFGDWHRSAKSQGLAAIR